MEIKEKAEKLRSEFEGAGELQGTGSFWWFEFSEAGYISLDGDFNTISITEEINLFEFFTKISLSEISKVAPIVKKLKELKEIYG